MILMFVLLAEWLFGCYKKGFQQVRVWTLALGNVLDYNASFSWSVKISN